MIIISSIVYAESPLIQIVFTVYFPFSNAALFQMSLSLVQPSTKVYILALPALCLLQQGFATVSAPFYLSAYPIRYVIRKCIRHAMKMHYALYIFSLQLKNLLCSHVIFSFQYYLVHVFITYA